MIDANRLHVVILAELPLQVVAADEAAQTLMKRLDMIIFEEDPDEGSPVVITLLRCDVIKQIAAEI